MSLAEAAAALDRALQQSNDLTPSQHPPQLPPPPFTTLPISKVTSLSPVANRRTLHLTSPGAEGGRPHARAIYYDDGLRMPDNSPPARVNIPADFCAGRYSNGRFRIVFSDRESKACANSGTPFQRNEFLTSDFGKRPMKKDIFSSIPTFPFRDMVSRPYIRNGEFYQDAECSRYRTSRPSYRDDGPTSHDGNYNDKSRYDPEWGTQRRDDFHCDWRASSRSSAKFGEAGRPFLDRYQIQDEREKWQLRCAQPARASKKPVSSEKGREPLLQITGPPLKFSGPYRSRSTTPLRSRYSNHVDFQSKEFIATRHPIPRSEIKPSGTITSTLVNSIALRKVDTARPRIIRKSTQTEPVSTLAVNGYCVSGDRRRSKSLSEQDCQSDVDACRPTRGYNIIAPVQSSGYPTTVLGNGVVPKGCSNKASGPDDGRRIEASTESCSEMKVIVNPEVVDLPKNCDSGRVIPGRQVTNKGCSEPSGLNFVYGTAGGLAVLQPVSYRSEIKDKSSTVLSEQQISKSDSGKDEFSVKENGFHTDTNLADLKDGVLKVAKCDNVLDDTVPLDVCGPKMSNCEVNRQVPEENLHTTVIHPAGNVSESQTVINGLDCRFVNLTISKTWNSTLKNCDGLCGDVTFSGNVDEHPDMIIDHTCRDWFGCGNDEVNHFELSNGPEFIGHCSISHEKNEICGEEAIDKSINDNCGEVLPEDKDINLGLNLHKDPANAGKLEKNSSEGYLDFSRALDKLCSAKNSIRCKEEFANSAIMDNAANKATVMTDGSYQTIDNSSSNMADFLKNADRNGLVASSPKRSKTISFVDAPGEEKFGSPLDDICELEGSTFLNACPTFDDLCGREEMPFNPVPLANAERKYLPDNIYNNNVPCFSSSKEKELSSEGNAAEGEESSMMSKSTSKKEIACQRFDFQEVVSEKDTTNEILMARAENGNEDSPVISSLLVPLNGRLPKLKENTETSSEESCEVGGQEPNSSLRRPSALKMQLLDSTDIAPSGVCVSNFLDDNSSSKIENSRDACSRDNFFSSDTKENRMKIVELDRQDESSKDSKESEDFHPLDPSKYKTELCRAFQIRGSCRYGTRCNYAHGLDQLKVSFHHGKYKTRNCQAYHETGYCRYGARCSFIHDLEEGILKCSIANKEILEALHHWPEEDSAPSATVTWKVFNKRRGRGCFDDTLIEFTAIPSIKPADLGSDCDLNSDDENNLGSSKVYTLEPNRYPVKQAYRSSKRNSSRIGSGDFVKGNTSSYGASSCRELRPEASVIEVGKSCEVHTSDRNRSNFVKCKDSPGVEERQSMIRNSVKDLMTLIKTVEPKYSGNHSNRYTSKNVNFGAPSMASSRRSSKVDVTFGENFMEDGSIHASVSFRKEEYPRRPCIQGHGDDINRVGPKYLKDLSRDSQFSETRPVSAKKRKCFSFHYKGFCLYGPDCQFLHDE